MRAFIGSVVLGCVLAVGCGGKGTEGGQSSDLDAATHDAATRGSDSGTQTGLDATLHDAAHEASTQDPEHDGSVQGPGSDATIEPSGPSPFGGFCDTDADCTDGLICLTAESSSWFGGGAAGGYCTLDCAAEPTLCGEFPNSICVVGGAANEAYCFEDCQNGLASVGEVKCHDRANSACFQVSATSSACLPTCGFDGECPEGRYCNLASGVCVDDVPVGLPLGATCEPDDDQNPCAGFCATFDVGYSVCTGYCTLGAAGGCSVDPSVTDIPSGAGVCLALIDQQNDNVGDTGVCIQRCDCNGTCSSSIGICNPFADPATEEQLQAKGLCIPPQGGNPGLVCEAADSGADSSVQ